MLSQKSREGGGGQAGKGLKIQEETRLHPVYHWESCVPNSLKLSPPGKSGSANGHYPHPPHPRQLSPAMRGRFLMAEFGTSGRMWSEKNIDSGMSEAYGLRFESFLEAVWPWGQAGYLLGLSFPIYKVGITPISQNYCKN